MQGGLCVLRGSFLELGRQHEVASVARRRDRRKVGEGLPDACQTGQEAVERVGVIGWPMTLP